MSAVITWFTIDLRRRWTSILALTLLIAFASATIMTAVAGARRASSAVDRLLSQTAPATVVALPNQPGFDWDAVRALPEVAAVGEFAVSGFEIEGVPAADYSTGFPVLGKEIYSSIEKPVVLEGRLLDPSRPDEVMVSSLFLEHTGLDIGDALTLRLWTPEQADASATGATDLGPPAGPTIEATIVGSIRSMWFSDLESENGGITPSPALFEQYPENFLGSQNQTYINALIRLTGGAVSIPTFKEHLAEVSGRNDIDVWDLAAAAEDVKDVISFEAASLTVFAVAAFAAALFLVGQAIARHVTTTTGDLRPLRAVGLTPAESMAAASLGPGIAAVSGVALGMPLAYAASWWFPLGTASWMEPAPGPDADWLVFGLALAAVPLMVTVGALITAAMSLSSTRRHSVARKSAIAARLARSGFPVPVVVGSRFALEPGRDQTSVPVRPALLGAVFGVLGIIAVFTFANGIDRTIDDPERFGQTWDLATFMGLNGQDFVPTDEVLAELAAEPEIATVNDTRLDVAQIDDVAVSMLTLDPVDAPLDVVLTEGAIAARRGEVTIGPRTAKATGLHVGDSVTASGPRGEVVLTVTGIGFVYPSPHNDYASGAWVTTETYDSLFDGFKFHMTVLDLVPGADPAVVSQHLAARGIEAGPNEPVPEMRQLQQVQAIPWFLAGFLALLGIGAVGHALATAVRRRRHDLAVLRAVGMTGPQSKGVVAAQATTLTVIGLAVGIPLGVALGRTVWRYVADITPVYYVPPVAILALLLIVPASLVATNLMAVRPSRRAAKMRLGDVLRAE